MIKKMDDSRLKIYKYINEENFNKVKNHLKLLQKMKRDIKAQRLKKLIKMGR